MADNRPFAAIELQVNVAVLSPGLVDVAREASPISLHPFRLRLIGEKKLEQTLARKPRHVVGQRHRRAVRTIRFVRKQQMRLLCFLGEPGAFDSAVEVATNAAVMGCLDHGQPLQLVGQRGLVCGCAVAADGKAIESRVPRYQDPLSARIKPNDLAELVAVA